MQTTQKSSRLYYYLIYIILFFPLLFSSCSFRKYFNLSSNPRANIVLRADYDTVWDETIKITSEKFPIFIADKHKGVIETKEILEFSLERQYRQYVQISLRVRNISKNFTAVSAHFELSRYSPIFHEWYPISAKKKQKKFLEELKIKIETKIQK